WTPGLRSSRSTRGPRAVSGERTSAVSNDGGRSTLASRISAAGSPERCHTARLAGYESAASGDTSHQAYSSPAVRGGVAGGAAPSRSNSDAARGSAAAPNPRASRSASTSRPSTAAPHVTSAAAVPATVAIPRTAQCRGAGGRRDATAEIADDVRRREHQHAGTRHRPPAARQPAAPHGRRGEQQNGAEGGERAGRGAEAAQHGAVERRGREQSRPARRVLQRA